MKLSTHQIKSWLACILLLLPLSIITLAQGPRPIRCKKPMIPRSSFWQQELDATKHHEASHAIAALEQGGRVYWIEINGPGDASCSCWGPAGARMSVVYAAGYAGEALRFPDRSPNGYEGDFENAAATGYPATSRVARATEILQQNWAAVEAVARALPNRGRLSGAAVRAIYQQHKSGGLINRGSSGVQEAERRYNRGNSSWLQWWDEMRTERGSDRQGSVPSGQSRGRRQSQGWDGSAADCRQRGGIYRADESSCHFK